MCYTHGKLIDTDEVRFTIPMLQTWKKIAEERAKCRIDGVADPAFEGIPPGECVLELTADTPENTLIGTALRDACLHELWGHDLAAALRDLTIEYVRNAFEHGNAQRIELSIEESTITLVDDGAAFDPWTLLRLGETSGGSIALRRIVKDFSHRIIVTAARKQEKNVLELSYIRDAADALDVSPCSVELEWSALKRGGTTEPVAVHPGCSVIYVVLPPFVTISDAAIIDLKLYDLKIPGRQFVFLTDERLSDEAESIIKGRFPGSVLVHCGP
jgi:hypothetical protein